ncbi:MAG TPA: (2Fe-2S)-binding protein, partial [Chitinophagaceae bacterium]
QAEYREFKEMILQQTELVEKRARLLRPGKQPGEGVTGRLICSCNSVGEGNLIKMIRQGCGSMDELCRQTGAGMGCGSCRPEVKNIWSRAKMK